MHHACCYQKAVVLECSYWDICVSTVQTHEHQKILSMLFCRTSLGLRSCRCSRAKLSSTGCHLSTRQGHLSCRMSPSRCALQHRTKLLRVCFSTPVLSAWGSQRLFKHMHGCCCTARPMCETDLLSLYIHICLEGHQPAGSFLVGHQVMLWALYLLSLHQGIFR